MSHIDPFHPDFDDYPYDPEPTPTPADRRPDYDRTQVRPVDHPAATRATRKDTP